MRPPKTKTTVVGLFLEGTFDVSPREHIPTRRRPCDTKATRGRMLFCPLVRSSLLVVICAETTRTLTAT